MKNLLEYELVIFDMDGTLYYHRPVQLQMGLKLLSFACTHRQGLRELSTILKYRKLREKWPLNEKSDSTDMERQQYEMLAEQMDISCEEAERIIKKWMFSIPLNGIYTYRDEKLLFLIQHLNEVGKKTVIYSDYDPVDKMNRLGLSEMPFYYGGQKELDCMKPDPRGIYVIMEQFGIMDKSSVLVIGDRMSKDGQLAVNAGVDYLIVKKGKLGRSPIYKTGGALCL